MLALDVNLLASKLQSQSLEESPGNPGNNPAPATNIKLIKPEDGGYKLSESTQATLAAAGKNVWTVSLNSSAGSRSNASQGHSVGKVAQGQERKFVVPHGIGSGAPKACCHQKSQRVYTNCDSFSTLAGSSRSVSGSSPGSCVGSGRPKKRHCRSLSLPQETDVSIPPAKSTWQPQGSGLWKPVAMATVGSKNRNCHLVNMARELNFSHNFSRTPTDLHTVDFTSMVAATARPCDPGHVTPEDFLTPPESPIPRPPSAVYSDGAISPLNTNWSHDFVPPFHNRHDAFRNRSLSLEDKISSNMSYLGYQASVPGPNHSMPSSPHHRYKVPRCRSQPSFYDRKSGRRRRRDCRPTLNFHKMTETAYGHLTRSDPVTTPHKDQIEGCRFHAELENVMSLMPIASSPRDSDIPIQKWPRESDMLLQKSPLGRNSPIHELEVTTRDAVAIGDVGGVSSGPVKLLGDDDENDMEVFQLTEELDLEEIENH